MADSFTLRLNSLAHSLIHGFRIGEFKFKNAGIAQIKQDLKVAVDRGSCFIADSWKEIAAWIGASPKNWRRLLKNTILSIKKDTMIYSPKIIRITLDAIDLPPVAVPVVNSLLRSNCEDWKWSKIEVDQRW
jgi:hypothetical protein